MQILPNSSLDNYCPDPGIPINGMKNSSNYDMGERISFSCQSGYTLLGTEIRECLPHRIWSGNEVKCVGKFLNFFLNVSLHHMLSSTIIVDRKLSIFQLFKYKIPFNTITFTVEKKTFWRTIFQAFKAGHHIIPF